jgi:hypothetical protein
LAWFPDEAVLAAAKLVPAGLILAGSAGLSRSGGVRQALIAGAWKPAA